MLRTRVVVGGWTWRDWFESTSELERMKDGKDHLADICPRPRKGLGQRVEGRLPPLTPPGGKEDRSQMFPLQK